MCEIIICWNSVLAKTIYVERGKVKIVLKCIIYWENSNDETGFDLIWLDQDQFLMILFEMDSENTILYSISLARIMVSSKE